MTWLVTDFLLLLLPFLSYFISSVILGPLVGNLFIELPLFTLSIGLATILRLLISRSMSEKKLSILLLFIWCVLGILIPLLTPPITNLL